MRGLREDGGRGRHTRCGRQNDEAGPMVLNELAHVVRELSAVGKCCTDGARSGTATVLKVGSKVSCYSNR